MSDWASVKSALANWRAKGVEMFDPRDVPTEAAFAAAELFINEREVSGADTPVSMTPFDGGIAFQWEWLNNTTTIEIRSNGTQERVEFCGDKLVSIT